MLHIHLSNRFEVLAARLLTELQRPAAGGLAGVFEPREVVVPSLAIRRALTLQLARFEGVCAHLRFDFLAPWLWSRLAGPGPRQSPFAAAGLTWRVYQAFADPAFVAAHPRLAAYLDGADALMHFELAGRCAALLEQYTTYRADGLQAWSAGQPWREAQDHVDADWQAALWRRVSLAVDAHEGMSTDPSAQALLRTLPQRAAHGPMAAALGRPAHLFGLPTIAPLHLQWLQRLAAHAEVHVYVLNPCQEHWFDLVDTRRLAQLRARGQAAGFEVGHRLLGGWGRQTQDHLHALVDASGNGEGASAVYPPARGKALLAQLQNSILELHEPGPGRFELAPDDRSLEVHVCHSLTRQLEVLHSHLLGLFAEAEAGGKPLPPGRVLVAVPDLDTAAPLIDAVFGTAPRERQLPYLVTGRARSQDDAPARAVLGLLALAGSRWAASEVFALLQQPLVARRFGLLQGHDDAGLQQVRDWLGDAGIRWGEDAAHRSALGLPNNPAHTWADGLSRLLLGYAMPGQAPEAAGASATSDASGNAFGSRIASPWAGLLPAGRPEGLQAQSLGGLWAFVQALGALRTQTAQPLAPAAWGPLLQQLIPRFLQAETGEAEGSDGAEALLPLQTAMAELSARWLASGVDTPLPLAVVRAALAEQLDASAAGGVPGGAITFASMASLRGLPYDVVCVLGLDDGIWPGTAPPLEFDLMAAHPRRGDRQRRIEDRNVFLDLLLSARRSLFLACTGRSLRDNAPLTPSVLVTELLDLLTTATVASAADAADPAARARARARLLVEHPMQPFALEAFDARPIADPRQRSRDGDMARALQASLQPGTMADAPSADQHTASADTGDDEAAARDPQPPFFTTPLPAPGEAERQVDAARLVAFFRHPSRALLRRRLGLALARHDEELADDEPFVPDPDTRRALASQLLPALLAGASAAEAAALARAGTAWPAGELGAAALATELQALQNYALRICAATRAPLLPPLPVTLAACIDGAEWTLTGALADLRPTGLVRWRHARASGADLLDAWLHHLLLCLGLQQNPQLQLGAEQACTTWLAADRDWIFEPVADPQGLLRALLRLYAQGQQSPLHLYPRTSWAWVDKPGTQAARNSWEPGPFNRYAEGADAHYKLALRGVPDALDTAFEAQAEAVFGPLRQHLRGVATVEEADDDA